jgi:hypothetical protein
LLNAGVELYALIGLHTKLYIIDDSCVFITSANYTYGGLYNNIELGIKIDNDIEIIQECSKYFEDLWDIISKYIAGNNGKGKITIEMIEKEKSIVNEAASTRTGATINSNKTTQGAEIGQSKSIDIIETAIKETYKSSITTAIGGWLKFEADAQHRHNPENSYLHDSTPFRLNKTFFPTKPVGIKQDDVLYLALVSYDKDNVATPIIIGRAKSNGFNDQLIVNKRNFQGFEEWMIDYPYYVELHSMEILKGPAKNGISLLELYRKLKGDIYPSTYGTDIPFEKIRQYHYQKDKIRITDYAANEINKELDELFVRFGKEDMNN